MEQKNWRQNLGRVLHALLNFVEVQLHSSLGQLVAEAIIIAVAIWLLYTVAVYTNKF